MPFINTETSNFLGKGIIFPIRLSNGSAQLFTGVELIRSSIRVILNWNYPRRFFLPEYNARLSQLLEEPNDENLILLIEHFTIEAIATWEKRVELTSFDVVKTDDKSIDVSISYKIINTQQVDSFIFPFYKNIIY